MADALTVSVTEADLALRLHQQLLADPKTRKQTLKLIKSKFPEASIPEIDAAEPVETELGALSKKFDELKTELLGSHDKFVKDLATKEQDAQILGKFSALKSARGYTDEGIENIKKLMVDKSIPDPEVAADHFDRVNYKPAPIEPTSWYGTNFINDKDEGVTSWLSDPDAMTDKIIGEVLTEARAGKL